jgi:hypothetical protein
MFHVCKKSLLSLVPCCIYLWLPILVFYKSRAMPVKLAVITEIFILSFLNDALYTQTLGDVLNNKL